MTYILGFILIKIYPVSLDFMGVNCWRSNPAVEMERVEYGPTDGANLFDQRTAWSSDRNKEGVLTNSLAIPYWCKALRSLTPQDRVCLCWRWRRLRRGDGHLRCLGE